MRILGECKGLSRLYFFDVVHSSNPGPVTPGSYPDGILYRLDDMAIEREEHKLSQMAFLYRLGVSTSRLDRFQAIPFRVA